MSNLMKLPNAAALAVALRQGAESMTDSDGSVILKMDKTGHWVFGADQTEVEDDSTWAVNPLSFVHGFIAWGDGEPLGEKMAPITEPLPEMGEAPPGAKRGWEKQVGLALKCLNGEDKDMEVRFSTTSVGGKKAVQSLAVQVAEQVEKDASTPVPVVALEKDHYQHKSYGRIYTPIFEVKGWMSMDGEAPPVEEAPVEEAPKRRVRK
jgi:hypothetical protein